jgi:hypothetical protein
MCPATSQGMSTAGPSARRRAVAARSRASGVHLGCGMSHSLVRIVSTVRANGRLARAEAYDAETLRGAHPGLQTVLTWSLRVW